MPDTTCNGWTNYATWRVALEIFDGYDPEGHFISGAYLAELADELLQDNCREGLALDYARAFLHSVNWQEIADHINEAHELNPEEN